MSTCRRSPRASPAKAPVEATAAPPAPRAVSSGPILIGRRRPSPLPRTAPDEHPAVGKSAEAILASIFAPVAEASPLEQLEQTIRHPKKLIYIAMSNRNFYWRMHVSKLVLDEGYVPINPFMLFDYYLLHTVPKQLVREAINNLLARCDEVWVFGTMSLGVKLQLGIAKRLKNPFAFSDIADLPEQVYRIPAKLPQEEGRD